MTGAKGVARSDVLELIDVREPHGTTRIVERHHGICRGSASCTCHLGGDASARSAFNGGSSQTCLVQSPAERPRTDESSELCHRFPGPIDDEGKRHSGNAELLLEICLDLVGDLAKRSPS